MGVFYIQIATNAKPGPGSSFYIVLAYNFAWCKRLEYKKDLDGVGMTSHSIPI